METTTRLSDFFQASGTLSVSAPSYVQRAADDDLFRAVMAGEFCYVLTARQMGKSSLMVRTAERVRAAGGRASIVDLSAIGTRASGLTPEQWYFGIVSRINRDLNILPDLGGWWGQRAALAPLQRFNEFLDAVVSRSLRTVIFVDEIDSTLALDFTDDFFITIRSCYNQRASNPAYEQLTFVLLGVAAPGDLIKNRDRTPFNIGRAITLREFSPTEAAPLREGLATIDPNRADPILARIFFWTSGQPYLTQRLCLELSEAPQGWSEGELDRLVARLFLADRGGSDAHFQYVRDYIEVRAERAELLRLYRRIYRGEAVAEDERSPLQNRLKLIGLIRAERGKLAVRNQIYRHIYDETWIRARLPRNLTLPIAGGALLVIILALAVLFWFNQQQQAQARLAEVRNFAGLCQVAPEEARRLFFDRRSSSERQAIFQADPAAAGADMVAAVRCLYPSLADQPLPDAERQALRSAMCCALQRLAGPEAEAARSELGCAIGACAP